jgi:hypothetical protein
MALQKPAFFTGDKAFLSEKPSFQPEKGALLPKLSFPIQGLRRGE